MKLKSLLVLLPFLLPACSYALKALPRTTSPKGASVYFVSPKEGEKLKSPILVQFGLKGMGVAPAGVKSENTGHHHLLIDVTVKDYGLPVGSDKQHVHFGKGQTETMIDLPPGKHTLQLLLANHMHIPHDPPVKSKVISITVEK